MALTAGLLALTPVAANAQSASRSLFLEARDGLTVPTVDIAFSDEAFVGTDNAWVWPFSTGIRASS